MSSFLTPEQRYEKLREFFQSFNIITDDDKITEIRTIRHRADITSDELQQISEKKEQFRNLKKILKLKATIALETEDQREQRLKKKRKWSVEAYAKLKTSNPLKYEEQKKTQRERVAEKRAKIAADPDAHASYLADCRAKAMANPLKRAERNKRRRDATYVSPYNVMVNYAKNRGFEMLLSKFNNPKCLFLLWRS